MRKHHIVITPKGQILRSPVSSPVNKDAWHDEELTENQVKELSEVEIIRKKGQIAEIIITLDIPVDVTELSELEDIRNVTIKKLRSKQYGGWIVNVTKACFNDGTIPHKILLIIREKGERGIQKKHLESELKSDGFKDFSSATIDGAIQALRDVVGIIEEKGYGEDKELKYIGKW